MRKAIAAFALLFISIPAVGAPPTVPRKYVGDWVPQASACDAPLRLRVGSSAVMLIDGAQSQSFQGLDVCLNCEARVPEGVEAVSLTPEAGAVKPPLKVRLYSKDNKGFAVVSIETDDLKARFALDKVRLRKCAQTTAQVESVAPANPVSVDIVGLRLGMTPDEIRQAMQTHDKNLRINDQHGALQRLPSSKFLSKVTGALERRLPGGPADAIGVHFPPAPHEAKALFIHRYTVFENDQQPLAKALQDALVKKYGTPSNTRGQDGRDIYLMWAFDASGVRLMDSAVERKCIRLGLAEPQSMSNVFFGELKSDECGITVYAQIQRNEHRGRGTVTWGELATYLHISVVDASRFPAMRAATTSHVDKSLRDSASKVQGPKL